MKEKISIDYDNYKGFWFSLKLASSLYSTILQNRKATEVNDDGVNELFELAIIIYTKGIRRKFWR